MTLLEFPTSIKSFLLNGYNGDNLYNPATANTGVLCSLAHSTTVDAP